MSKFGDDLTQGLTQAAAMAEGEPTCRQLPEVPISGAAEAEALTSARSAIGEAWATRLVRGEAIPAGMRQAS